MCQNRKKAMHAWLVTSVFQQNEVENFPSLLTCCRCRGGCGVRKGFVSSPPPPPLLSFFVSSTTEALILANSSLTFWRRTFSYLTEGMCTTNITPDMVTGLKVVANKCRALAPWTTYSNYICNSTTCALWSRPENIDFLHQR